jgi:hypothetical protein
VDPIISNPMNPQSVNPYSYIGNNPLSGVDPTGYVDRSICNGTGSASNCTVAQVALPDANQVVGYKFTTTTKFSDGTTTTSTRIQWLNGADGATAKAQPASPLDVKSPGNIGRENLGQPGGRQQLPQPPVWDPAKRMAQGLMMMADPSYGFWPTSTDGDAYIAHVDRRLAQGRQDFALGAFELALTIGSLLPGAGAAEGAVVARAESSFAGTPAQMLQGITNAQNAKLAANPALAATVLSPAEYAAGQASVSVARLGYGNAVERLVAQQIGESAQLRSVFQHVGGPGRADFLGVGRAAGMTFDITTPGQVASHLARPYGPGMSIVTYQRPPWFTTLPQ